MLYQEDAWRWKPALIGRAKSEWYSADRMLSVRKIGVLTGGGDAPGRTAVIRAVAKAAHNAGIEVIGLEDSFDGLLDASRTRQLRPSDVTGILRLGGTILGTTNRGIPFD